MNLVENSNINPKVRYFFSQTLFLILLCVVYYNNIAPIYSYLSYFEREFLIHRFIIVIFIYVFCFLCFSFV